MINLRKSPKVEKFYDINGNELSVGDRVKLMSSKGLDFEGVDVIPLEGDTLTVKQITEYDVTFEFKGTEHLFDSERVLLLHQII
jgi:hypothetical protein